MNRRPAVKRYVTGIAVCAVTFLIGTAATQISYRVYPRFEQLAVGGIVCMPGGRGGFSSYGSYDGEYLFCEHCDFLSREGATTSFKASLQETERIIKREPLYDRAGTSIVGERVVAIIRTNDGREGGAVIVLEGTEVYWFGSTSLRHALFFERSQRRF